jgi:hypothetical protein
MSGLTKTVAAMGGAGTRRTYGTAHWDGTRWYAKIGPNFLDPRWLDPIQPVQGGKIVIDISTDEFGQATALVIGGYTDQPRPSTGTVLTVGVTEVVFTGEDGTVYSTDRFIGTYGPGDLVFFAWAAGKPVIIGEVPSITVVHPAAEPVPPGTVTGETVLIATASDTFGVGGWGRWATSQPAQGGEDVYSGTLGTYTVTGAWFYGAPKPELSGKTVNRIRFNVPPRLPAVGGYSSPVTIHLYIHTSQSRPAGDVTRIAGPFDIVVNPGSAGGLVDIPGWLIPDAAAALAAGGGFSIAGNPYVGFASRLENPENGKAILNWSS